MYPYHERDAIHVNNIDWVGDLYKRKVFQRAETQESIGVKVLNVLTLSLRNVYQTWKQLPEKMHIKMPKVLSLHIRNVLRRYTSTPVRMHIKLPQVVEVFIRSYLQKLFSYPLDDIFVVHVPQVVDLHKKNIVGKYIEDEYGKLTIQIPEVTELYLRSEIQKYQHEGETTYLTLPQDIEITGTTKPYIRSPVLSGSVVEGEVFNIDLEWQDDSLTHTGYLLYKDTAPIGADTELEPIQEFDRYTTVYEDWDVEEGTTYYYRITPKSIYGRFFSNLLTVDVPLYLRAPENFEVGFQSISAPVESKGTNRSLGAVLNSGSQKIVFRLAGVESPYGAISQWSSLTVPGGIKTSTEEDQGLTLFSGYMPPVGFPMSYDAYRVGDSVIPVFRKQVIPGDMTRFTIYERMFNSKEVTSGYRSPNGVDIRFSLFVDED